MIEPKNAPLDDELQTSYIDYAMSVIIGRAIPDARDGLKPVQRRILYAMYTLKNFHNLPTKKSARIVGECFVRGTLVSTTRGLIPIQKVRKNDIVYTQTGKSKVTELYAMPKRKLIKIQLNNGTENIITRFQKFKVITPEWKFVWKEAEKLQLGDYIITKATYPNIPKEVKLPGGKHLNKNMAYLLGQLISDGFVINDNERHKYHRIGFCSDSAGIITKIIKCLKEEFNYEAKIEEKTRKYEAADGKIRSSKVVYQIRVNSQTISQFFIKTFSLSHVVAYNKQIPEQIFRSPEEIIFAFASGLIDGDGHIRNSRNVIEYATISPKLANQIMVLFQHLGIQGKRYESKREGQTTYILGRKVKLHNSYSLEFTGVHALKLAQKLELCDEKKRGVVKKLLGEVYTLRSDADIMPWGGKHVFGELSKKHLGGGWYQSSNGGTFRAGIKYKTGSKIRYSAELYEIPLHMSQIRTWGIQEKLQRINSPIADTKDSVSKSNLFFSKVVSIGEAGEDQTYDIQVAKDHEFIANGMISHNCIGKYHPHGDLAVYDALVRMAQDFSMHHRLVEGQGNMGSVDGDPPAAQRYTEVRLTKLAEEILNDLDKETVEFTPNFDNTETEPVTLPAKAPNLLINGASGIAVGVATSIPPHNLNEVCDAIVHVLGHKEATVEDLLGIIKGPDFPTGGIAIMSQNAYAGYRHGRGQTTVRAKAEIDEKRRKIIVNEIPYNVNKAIMIQTIAELVRDKRIIGIKDLRDESDKSGIRITIDLKEDANPEQVLNMLYKHTQMEVTFPIINLAVVGKSLRSMNLLTMIQTFIDYRREIVLKRSRFELAVATDRLHIVKGLLLAIDKIDDIIKDIKESGEIGQARSKLMSGYSLSEKQANAILDMKLSRLTHLESDSLDKEKAELTNRVSYFKAITEQPERVDQIIKEETIDVKKQFGKPRKTEILNIDEPLNITEEDMISNERVTVIMTNKGYVKRQGITSFKEQGRGGRGIIAINLTEGDYVKEILTCNNKDYLLCISNAGRAYWIKAYNIPEGSRYGSGKAIVNLLNINQERIMVMLDIKNIERSNIAFLTAKGVVKKTDAVLFSKPRSNGIRAINLREGDEISDVIIYSSDKYLTILTKLGKSIKFEEEELRQIGRTAAGVRGIKLRGNDLARNIISATDTGSILTVTENGYGKLTDISKYRTQARGGSGVINIKINEKTGPVSKALFASGEQQLMLINSKGISITIPIESIRITGRAASGVRLMKLEAGAKVVDARVIRTGEANGQMGEANGGAPGP